MEKLDEHYYLIYQPIRQITGPKNKLGNVNLQIYEVLLRSKETDRFPHKDFPTLIKDNESNKQFFDWVVPQFIEQFDKHPNVELSVNFDVDQWAYPSTFEALDVLQAYADRLVIEVTEHLPRFHCEVLSYYGDILRLLNDMGFKIAVDDIGEGINTFRFFLRYREHISTVKVAVYNKRWFGRPRVYLIMNCLFKLLGQKQMDIVVERVETQDVSSRLRSIGIVFQQGKFFGMGQPYIKINKNKSK